MESPPVSEYLGFLSAKIYIFFVKNKKSTRKMTKKKKE